MVSSRALFQVHVCELTVDSLYYILKYPPSSSPAVIASEADESDVPPPPKGAGKGYDDAERERAQEKYRPQVAGAFVLCPALEGGSLRLEAIEVALIILVASSSRPWAITELIGRGLRRMAGTFPVAKSLRGECCFDHERLGLTELGQVSNDPRVEEDFYADRESPSGMRCDADQGSYLLPRLAQGWHGPVPPEGDGGAARTSRGSQPSLVKLSQRCYTMLTLLTALKIAQGKNDRVVDYRAAQRFFARLPHEDKEVEIYDGYEHVMMRVSLSPP